MKFKSFFVHTRSAVYGVHSQIKNKEMGGARGTYLGEESCTEIVGGETSQQTIWKTSDRQENYTIVGLKGNQLGGRRPDLSASG
jgi:hypothetical protein